jgi:hypothetical protein
MANVTIPIKRYQYDATDATQLNGYPPNVISSALSGQAITSSDTIKIPADFKDHKTVFVINNTNSGSASVTIKAGNTYQGVNDLVISAPAGLSFIWLDSAKFVDKVSGEITVVTTATEKLAMFGYEMR